MTKTLALRRVRAAFREIGYPVFLHEGTFLEDFRRDSGISILDLFRLWRILFGRAERTQRFSHRLRYGFRRLVATHKIWKEGRTELTIKELIDLMVYVYSTPRVRSHQTKR